MGWLGRWLCEVLTEGENRGEDDEIDEIDGVDEMNEVDEVDGDEDGVIFITDTIEDPALRPTINDHDKQADFVAFEDVDTDDER